MNGMTAEVLSYSRRQTRAARIRWHSFAKSHRSSVSESGVGGQLISGMSAGQLAVLHRLATLRLTASLEKYSPSQRAGRSWSVTTSGFHLNPRPSISILTNFHSWKIKSSE